MITKPRGEVMLYEGRNQDGAKPSAIGGVVLVGSQKQKFDIVGKDFKMGDNKEVRLQKNWGKPPVENSDQVEFGGRGAGRGNPRKSQGRKNQQNREGCDRRRQKVTTQRALGTSP